MEWAPVGGTAEDTIDLDSLPADFGCKMWLRPGVWVRCIAPVTWFRICKSV
jgi:hypothetical protein